MFPQYPKLVYCEVLGFFPCFTSWQRIWPVCGVPSSGAVGAWCLYLQPKMLFHIQLDLLSQHRIPFQRIFYVTSSEIHLKHHLHVCFCGSLVGRSSSLNGCFLLLFICGVLFLSQKQSNCINMCSLRVSDTSGPTVLIFEVNLCFCLTCSAMTPCTLS